MADKNTAATAEDANTTPTTPVVTRDPRFKAGRSLVQKGLAQEGAIDLFATLLEEALTKYGESSIEAAPAYYEYGNALVRAASRAMAQEQAEVLEPAADALEAAAAAAEERLKSNNSENGEEKEEEDKKPAAVDDKEAEGEQENEGDDKEENPTGDDENGDDNDNENDEEDGSDLNLALEMMENSFSILEEYKESSNDEEKRYLTWVNDELPRVLLGIGDTLAALERHADAADVYSRVLEFRQSQLQDVSNKNKETLTVEPLKAHRRVCEATVLIAEELLACPPDEDVVTTETKALIVKAAERVEYARGYYDKARDALQETVFYMGKLAAKNMILGDEKEDVCFIATMVMGVGETLAAIDEAAAEDTASTEPAKKKAKM